MELRKDILIFLSKNMCIDVDELIEKINSPGLQVYSESLYQAIELFHDALSSSQVEDKILSTYMKFGYLHSHNEAHIVLDSLRHAFDGFAYNGLHQLYTRQENEAWYPKIKLVQELKPNDIKKLGKIVTIFRGCSRSEFLNECYGQAWTTNKDIAKMFAYKHYQAQPWFNSRERVVLRSSIPRWAIFYSNQSVEFEVVIDTNYLGSAEVIS